MSKPNDPSKTRASTPFRDSPPAPVAPRPSQSPADPVAAANCNAVGMTHMGGEVTADAAAATATATDQESFYARILAEGPSMDEVAARATPAYVKSLMEAIDRGTADSAAMLGKIEELAKSRAQRDGHERCAVREKTAELHVLRQQVAQVLLQLQEERERSTRLLHENTVLYTQGAEQQERLAALVELAQRRGKAIQRRDAGEASPRPQHSLSRSSSSRLPPAPTNSLSLRAVTAGAATSTLDSPSLPIRDGQPPPQGHRGRPWPREESIITGDGSIGSSSHCIGGDSHRQQQLAHTRCEEAGPDTGAGEEDMELLAALRPRVNTSAAHILALTEEVQMLRQQLDEQRTTYEHERGVRIQQERDEHREHLDMLDQQGATVSHLEELHECALRDLVVYRHRTDKALRDARGQVDWLRQALSEAITVAEATKRQHHVTATAMELRATDRYRPLMKSLSRELGSKRQASQHDRTLFEAAMAEKERVIEGLRDAVKHERVLKRRAEERHRLEVQGVRSELDMMRLALRQVEKKVFFRKAREELAMSEEQHILEHYYPSGGML